MDEIEVGLDWDELYPVFILVSDPTAYRQRDVRVPRALLDRYQTAEAEWQAVQALLHEIEQKQRD